MEEFDAPAEHGVKQMRETIDRKDETIKKLEAELASFKDKEINNVFGYDGPVDLESISQFAKDEYGFEPTGQVEEITQPAPEPVVQDDARARVAALDANSVSEVPRNVDEQLANIMKNGTVKQSMAAKLGLMEQQKK
jgi:hypothetical protein